MPVEGAPRPATAPHPPRTRPVGRVVTTISCSTGRVVRIGFPHTETKGRYYLYVRNPSDGTFGRAAA
jgi:hypothetical protein